MSINFLIEMGKAASKDLSTDSSAGGAQGGTLYIANSD